MTEDEAKTKWCPFARLACESTNGLQGPYNRVDLANALEGASSRSAPILAPCIASACGCWRWLVAPELANKVKTAQGRNDRLYEDSPNVASGYCGLAGTPVS